MNPIPLLIKNSNFSPFTFYNDFIKDISSFYKKNENQKIEFSLVIESDIETIKNSYHIDPITLPLLLSLTQQLSKFHKSPIKLYLSNTPGTIDVLEFLYRSDFFFLIGSNTNPCFPIGKDIFEFNDAYLGGFKGKKQRVEHKIRCYSLQDDNLMQKIEHLENDESKRDYLVEYYIFKVKEHFSILLNENEYTELLVNDFVEILSELITNGVIHSMSDTFALMFSDRYKTKFSISDNGIGLYNSLCKKTNNHFYTKFEILNLLSTKLNLKIPDNIRISLLSIFETLYYSMIKERQGLFDLMCKVVINCNGYFRLHNDNAQIVVSSRMLKELEPLYVLRKKILDTHNRFLFKQTLENVYFDEMRGQAVEGKKLIEKLADSIFKKYNEDTRFSSIRLFEVKFRGVHIEVEIPNTY